METEKTQSIIDKWNMDPDYVIEMLQDVSEFDAFRRVSDVQAIITFRLHERLTALRIPQESMLVGRTLADSRLGDAFGLTVLNIRRDETTQLMPDSQELLKVGFAAIKEDPSLIDEDVEMLEDLVAAAINDAVHKVEKSNQAAMQEMTAGLNLPPGFKLPF